MTLYLSTLQNIRHKQSSSPWIHDSIQYDCETMSRTQPLMKLKNLNDTWDVSIDYHHHNFEKPSASNNVLKVLTLAILLIGGACSTPFSSVLDVENPVLKLTWRQITMLPFLWVGSIIEYICLKKTILLNFSLLLSPNFLLKLVFFGILGNLMSLGCIWSAEYTIMSHA